MKKTSLLILLNVALGLTRYANAETTTAFTYQGKLTDSGSSANGNCEMQFKIYDQATAGTQLPTTLVTLTKMVPVADGLFTVSLDFGPNVFTGAPRWLQIEVRTNDNPVMTPYPYAVLAPRTEVTQTPYAIYAQTAGSVTDANLARLNSSQTFSVAPTFNSSGAPFAVGNKNLVANLNADWLDGLDSTGFWKATGNSGTTSASFLGTTDLQPVEFKVNGARALKLEPNNNFVGGSANNGVLSGVGGATIGGGHLNTISTNYATIGGGLENVIGTAGGRGGTHPYPPGAITISGGYRNLVNTDSRFSVIGGGYGNAIETNATAATISGGEGNSISGEHSFIGGGYYNAAHAAWSTIGGGGENLVEGYYGTIPGGRYNYVGPSAWFGMAAGFHAQSLHPYSFVWAGGGGGDFSSTAANQFLIRASGGVGIGTASPKRNGLHVNGDYYGKGHLWLHAYQGDGSDGNAYVQARDDSGSSSIGMVLRTQKNGVVRDALTLDPDGKTTVKVLTITGGADLAEPFQMSNDNIPKGALVVIDEQNAGRLKLSEHAYDSRVAGIVSGANGINPGVMLHQEGALEGGQNVALSGRVYALADATNEAIKPGDLLTTSLTPGHCMKATDREKSQGAIIGKAMTALADGKGMVLVLVSLQ